MLPGLPQTAEKGVGSTQQQHRGQQDVAPGEHRQVLLHDGVEQGGHQLLRRYPQFLQAVDVALGEHAAFARYRVELDALVRHFAEPVGGQVELGGDLVQHGAGAPGALVVHGADLALLAAGGILPEEDDLGVLTTELDHRTGSGVELLHRQGDRVDLLDETSTQQFGEHAAAGAGDADLQLFGARKRERLFDRLQERQHLAALLAVMALVALPDGMAALGLHHHRLDGGGAHVQPHLPADHGRWSMSAAISLTKFAALPARWLPSGRL